jgi:hypothetical protein
MDLLKEIRKVAARHPETRPALVSLLRRASLSVTASEEDLSSFDWDEVLVGPLARVRIKSYPYPLIVIEELPQKGKRRLKRFTWQISRLDVGGTESFLLIPNLKRDWKLSRSMTAERANAALQHAILKALVDWKSESPATYPEYADRAMGKYGLPTEEDIYYLKVEPVDMVPVEVQGDTWFLRSSWASFEITWKPHGADNHAMWEMQGDPSFTKYTSKSAGGARKLFKFLKASANRPGRMGKMSFDELLGWIKKQKIAMDSYSSRW